jgi:hypothetical protein
MDYEPIPEKKDELLSARELKAWLPPSMDRSAFKGDKLRLCFPDYDPSIYMEDNEGDEAIRAANLEQRRIEREGSELRPINFDPEDSKYKQVDFLGIPCIYNSIHYRSRYPTVHCSFMRERLPLCLAKRTVRVAMGNLGHRKIPDNCKQCFYKGDCHRRESTSGIMESAEATKKANKTITKLLSRMK